MKVLSDQGEKEKQRNVLSNLLQADKKKSTHSQVHFESLSLCTQFKQITDRNNSNGCYDENLQKKVTFSIGKLEGEKKIQPKT